LVSVVGFEDPPTISSSSVEGSYEQLGHFPSIIGGQRGRCHGVNGKDDRRIRLGKGPMDLVSLIRTIFDCSLVSLFWMNSKTFFSFFSTSLLSLSFHFKCSLI